MKPTPNFLNCLRRFTHDGLCFAEEMSAAVVLPEGTKLSKLVNEFRPLQGSVHLWLVAVNQRCHKEESFSDCIFPYDELTTNIAVFLKKVFMSPLDQTLIGDKIVKCHTLSAVVSFHERDKMSGFKVISSVLFQELPDSLGYYLPYLGTTADSFRLRGSIGDNRPWRRRGLTSLLLHLLQTLCQLHCNATSIFLECRETLVPTYAKLGFSRCDAVNKSWDVPVPISLEPSVDLVRMWIGSRVVTQAAISGTAYACHNRPFRSCCRDLAFTHVRAQGLFELDVFLFEYIDCYEHEDNGYTARCTMCGDISEAFSLSAFSLRFYEYASSHLRRCPVLRKDTKKRQVVDHMSQTMHEAQAKSNKETHHSVCARSEWLNRYCKAVSESACIPGCGVPCDPKNKSYQRLLFNLPQRYSVRQARRAPTSPTGLLDPATSVITHLQYSASGKFVGYNISGSADVLDEDFVNSEFHEWFILYVIKLSPRKFGVPDGAPNKLVNQSSVVHHPNTQKIQYLTQQLHRETCVFSSALSAFRYFGDFRAVASLRDRLFQSTMKPDRLGFLVRSMASRELNYVPKVFRRGRLNLLTDLSPFPTAARLCGMDGSSLHVVTIVGRLIFDSNFLEPLPLCKDALDWCCSYNSGERNEFAFVVKAYRFVHHKPRKFWLHTI